MDKISVHEILLKEKRWKESSEFLSLVAASRNVTERQAWNLVRKAYDSKDIQKHIFPDGRVWYGLTEFGLPTSERSPTVDHQPQKDLADAGLGIAEKYFQWRGTPDGGGNRFYRFMFPEKSEHTKKKD